MIVKIYVTFPLSPQDPLPDAQGRESSAQHAGGSAVASQNQVFPPVSQQVFPPVSHQFSPDSVTHSGEQTASVSQSHSGHLHNPLSTAHLQNLLERFPQLCSPRLDTRILNAVRSEVDSIMAEVSAGSPIRSRLDMQSARK